MRVLLFALAIPLLAVPPNVTTVAIFVDFRGHSSLGDSTGVVVWDADATFNAARIRIIPASSGTCTSGTGGYLYTNGTGASQWQIYGSTSGMSGLAPSTTYNACPEISNDGGSSWSSGGPAVNFTTLARTVTLPTAPTPVPIAFPAQSGAILPVMSDCSDFQTQITAAVPGDTIVVPAGTLCTAGNYEVPRSPTAKSFMPSDVTTSTSNIHIVAHGYANNDPVVMAARPAGQCLPGSVILSYGITNSCTASGGWQSGVIYYVQRIDADNIVLLDAPSGTKVLPGWVKFTADTTADTISIKPVPETPLGYAYNTGSSIPTNTVFQVYSTGSLPAPLTVDTNYYFKSACAASQNALCTVQISTTMGGAAINLTTTGTGTLYLVDQGIVSTSFYIDANPPALGTGHDIVITSSGSCPAAGTRVTSASDAQFFHIQKNTSADFHPAFLFNELAHNWVFRCMIFDSATNSDYLTTTNPRPYLALMTTYPDNANILGDRVRVIGPGYPNRISSLFDLQGSNIGFINSDMRDMTYWHPYNSGILPSLTNSTHFALSTGTFNGGAFTTTLSGATTVTLTGGAASGTGYVYFAMDGTLKILFPLTMTATCTTTGTTCTVLTSASPAYPVDGNGRVAAGRVATFTLVTGSATAVQADDNGSSEVGEGCQCITAGIGPGPYIFDNNYIQGTGNVVHFDDGGVWARYRHDYTITRNTFDTQIATLVGNPADTTGLRFFHRQQLEWKGGQRILVDGNLFQGSFADVSPACLTIAVTPRVGGVVSDFDFTNNQVGPACGGLNPPATVSSPLPQSEGSKRIRIANNAFNLDGTTYSAVTTPTGARGWTNEGDGILEDVLMDHNTAGGPGGSSTIGAVGTTPSFYYDTRYPIGGMVMTNNTFFYTGDLPAIKGEDVGFGCGYGADKTLMDCAWTNGPGTPGYTFSGNVIIPSWSSSPARSGFVGTATVTTAYGALVATNPVPAGGSQAANVGLVNFNANLSLNSGSPYYSTPCTLPCGYISIAAPTSPSATPGDTTVSLSWTATAGVSVTYKVYRGTLATGEAVTPIATGISATSYMDTGLSNGTAYYYKIAAVSGPATSPQSSEVSATPAAFSGTLPVQYSGGVRISGGVH